MASSSSQSQQNTKDLLIYVFYDTDIEGLFTNRSISGLINSDDLFPRIDIGENFIDQFDFRVKKPGKNDVSLDINEYKSWISTKKGIIVRDDQENNVDVVYLWTSFIQKHKTKANRALMNFLMNREKKFIYLVKFCHNVGFFRHKGGLKRLKNAVNADPNTSEIDLFRLYKEQILLQIFIDDFFKNDDDPSINVFKNFISKIGFSSENDIVPCFITKQHDVGNNVISVPAINKYTSFFFFEFETYMSDIYSDYRVKSLLSQLEIPSMESMYFEIHSQEVNRLKAKLTKRKDKIIELQAIIREKEIENESLRQAIENVNIQTEENLRILQEMSMVQQPSLTSDYIEEISTLRQKIRELKTSIRALEIELRSEQTENERLQANVANRDFIIKHHLKTIAESGSSPELAELRDMYNTLAKEYNDYRTQSEERIQALEVENMGLRNSESACSIVVRELRGELDRYKQTESSQESSFELVTSEQVEETFGEFGDISVISEEQELPGQVMSPESSSSEVERLEDRLENLERQEIIKTDEIEAKKIASEEIKEEINQLALSLNTVSNEDERNQILVNIQRLRNNLSDQQEDIAHTRFELYNEITRPKEETEEKLVEAVEKRVEEGEESTLLPLELELEESSESFIAPEETEITFKHREEITSTPLPSLQITSSQMNELFNLSLSIGSHINITQSKILLENVQNMNHLPISLGQKQTQIPQPSTSFRFDLPESLLDEY